MNQVCSRDPFDGEAGGRVGTPTTITTKLILPAYPIDFFSPFLGYGLPAFNCSQARRQAGKRPLASACPPTTAAAGPPAHSSVPRFFLLSNQWGFRSVDKSRIYHFDFPLILMRLAALVMLSPPHHNNLFLCSFAVCLKLWHVSKTSETSCCEETKPLPSIRDNLMENVGGFLVNLMLGNFMIWGLCNFRSSTIEKPMRERSWTSFRQGFTYETR